MLAKPLPRLTPDELHAARTIADVAQQTLSQRMFGVSATIDQLLIAFFSGGHILLDDVPGTGKTTLTKAFARLLDLSFARIQCTPDLLPGDIAGGLIYSPKTGEFTLRKGPIFANVVLVDEINRALPRTQSALLEAMAEGQVTIDGESIALPQPFMVIATQNPLESQGVFPLPEAQLDRFLMKTSLGYPALEDDVQILNWHLSNEAVEYAAPMVASAETHAGGFDVQSLFALLPRVYIHPDVVRYIAVLVRATREQPDVRIGASPRAMVMLARAARSRALLAGRPFVIPDDVKAVALPILMHRLTLQGYLDGQSDQEAKWMNRLLETVPAPLEDALS